MTFEDFCKDLFLLNYVFQDSSLHVQTDFCLMRGIIPKNIDILLCHNGYHGNTTSTADGQGKFKVIVPYPRAGFWFVGIMLRCYRQAGSNER